jgi:hypothetical protein
MTEPRTDAVLAAIAARYPWTRIEIRPNSDPGTAEDMPDHIYILDVPADRGYEIGGFALDVAFAVFADGPLPFLIGTVDPEQSARHFPRAPVAGQVSEP